jgi:hypothetical protein
MARGNPRKLIGLAIYEARRGWGRLETIANLMKYVAEQLLVEVES